MVKCCCICKRPYKTGQGRSFHSFPKNEEMRRKWISTLGKENILITKNTCVCSDHFLLTDLVQNTRGITHLKKNALPFVQTSSRVPVDEQSLTSEDIISKSHHSSDIMMVENHMIKTSFETNSSTISTSPVIVSDMELSGKSSSATLTASEINYFSQSPSREIEIVTKQIQPMERKKIRRPRYFGDCSSDAMNSPKRAKLNWEIAKKTVSIQKKKIRNLQLARRRMKARIYNLRTLLRHMKEKYGVTESAESVIKASLPESCGHIFSRLLKGPSNQKYTPQIRNFALTLSFYSTKAYNYVRQQFNKSLPHTSTISKWYQSINGSPGFTKEALNALSIKVQENTSQGQKTICSLMMDEMSIMRQVQWTGKKFTGYVDLGTNLDSDELPEAKEALMFMLVAVNGHWKIPLGYFLIDGLNGVEKANLVTKLLHFINESGVTVTSLTFDGAPSNMCMATALGADFSNTASLKTFFCHPVTNHHIFLFLDICHMLKLIRNFLASQKQFHDGNGNIISWNYFEHLVHFENIEGLKAGTKIKKRHIEWFREKMKVKLASQTFSKSVADAFRYLKNMNLDQFTDVDATADFTEIMNNLFDIFNVHTQYSKYAFKRALSQHTAEFIFTYLNFAKSYIERLNINGVSVLKSRRRTGFLGFLIAINSLECIYKYYIGNNYMSYILTYKFSQDHLEIFFSVIRSKGGSNNNPTAWQFENIYKRLLLHAELKGSNYANSIAMDCTSILHCSSLTKSNIGVNLLESDEYKNMSEKVNELDFLSSSAWHLTVYCEDVVAYIAGFVVRCLKRCVTCDFCYSLLESSVPLSNLQIQKKYGSLINASSFVISICKTAERCFRVFLLNGSIFNTNSEIMFNILIVKTLRNLPLSIFDELKEHIYDTDHSMNLIKLVLRKYFSIRIHHEIKKKNDSKSRIRNMLTKAILFKNQ